MFVIQLVVRGATQNMLFVVAFTGAAWRPSCPVTFCRPVSGSAIALVVVAIPASVAHVSVAPLAGRLTVLKVNQSKPGDALFFIAGENQPPTDSATARLSNGTGLVAKDWAPPSDFGGGTPEVAVISRNQRRQ
jgi:hypothetical protein